MTAPDVPAALTHLHHEAVRATCRLIAHNLQCVSEGYTLRMGTAALDDRLTAQAVEVACATLDTALRIVNAAEKALT